MKTAIVIPVYNEEKTLGKSIKTIRNFLIELNPPWGWEIIIADNASKDNTLNIAKKLSEKYEQVDYIHLAEKGRGRALKKAWMESNADIFAYMDVDLATDLSFLPLLVGEIINGAHIATGSRHSKGSNVKNSLKRKILSKGYNLLVQIILRTKIKDLQCGFKAIDTYTRDTIVPKCKDNEFFFDTELLIRAENAGLKIAQIPVKWTDDPDSRVNIKKTVKSYLINTVKLRKELKRNRDKSKKYI